jgi:lipopolysaccharide export system protein LptC
MLTPRLLFPLIPAVLLTAGAVLWLLPSASQRAGSGAEAESPLDADFDYFVTTMHRVTFTPEGQQMHTLEAARVVHYPDDDRAELERPALEWYEKDAAPWNLSADAGTLRGATSDAEDLLELRDNVVLTRPLENGSTFTARTSRLDAVLATREFSTDQPVTLDSGDMHMDGIGMRGNVRDRHVELLQNVRGRHAPITR